MPTKPKHSLQRVLKAIAGSGGVKITICRRLKVSRPTLDRYLKKWKRAAEALEQERKSLIDYAEHAVYKAVKDKKDLKTSRWLLERLAAHRGYAKPAPRPLDPPEDGTVIVTWHDPGPPLPADGDSDFESLELDQVALEDVGLVNPIRVTRTPSTDEKA